jgi:hypothetical protein
MSLLQNDQWFEDRHQWLHINGRTEKDIMLGDGEGQFIYVDGDNGIEKVRLPDIYQDGYAPDLKEL